MTYPNTLIFVDLASDDPEAAGRFYNEVFGWKNEGRPAGLFHRLDPGEKFLNSAGEATEVGNLHLGIHNANNQRPHPNPALPPMELAGAGAKARIWILISDDDDIDDVMVRALALGATELWRDHYWAEFNGYNAGFRDPWGNDIVLWRKAGPEPQIPDNFTRE